MSKTCIIILLLAPLFVCSQSEDFNCDNLKHGVFELYKESLKTGTIYRKGKYQIEKYTNSEKLTIAKLKSDKCLFYLNSYEIKNDLDTITWSVSYKKIKQDHYSFIGKPTYLDIDFTAKGEIVKISNKIDDEILKILNELKANVSN